MKPIKLFAILFLFGNCSFAQNEKILVENFYSPSVALQLKYTVILPSTYNPDRISGYPVMYLLHGHTGNYTSWLSYAKLNTGLASTYNTIIILPDAGNSWYVNWTGQTDGKPHKWEDMIVKDLANDVESKYNISAERNKRSLGGLSMGGFGAISIGLKNPDHFGFLFSISGALNYTQNIKEEFIKDTLDWNSPILWSKNHKVIDAINFSTDQERTPKGNVFKSMEDVQLYDLYHLLRATSKENLPFMLIACGIQDYFIKDARQFRNQLQEITTEYTYIESPGTHDVPFWSQSMEMVFVAYNNFLINN